MGFRSVLCHVNTLCKNDYSGGFNKERDLTPRTAEREKMLGGGGGGV